MCCSIKEYYNQLWIKMYGQISIFYLYKNWKTDSELLWFYNFHLLKEVTVSFCSYIPRVYHIIGTQYMLKEWLRLYIFVTQKFVTQIYLSQNICACIISCDLIIPSVGLSLFYQIRNKRLWDKFTDMLCTRIQTLGGSGRCAPLAQPFA